MIFHFLVVYFVRKMKQVKKGSYYCNNSFSTSDESPVHAGMPKDDDLFDQFGHRLFRDAYRIRAEDTFDLRYLTENKGLKQLQALPIELSQIILIYLINILTINSLSNQCQVRMLWFEDKFMKFLSTPESLKP